MRPNRRGQHAWAAAGALLLGGVLAVVDEAAGGTAIALASKASAQKAALIKKLGGGEITIAVGRGRLQELGLPSAGTVGPSLGHFWTSTPRNSAGELACVAAALADPGAEPIDLCEPGPVRTVAVSEHPWSGRPAEARVAVRLATLANSLPVAFATPIVDAGGERLRGGDLDRVIEAEGLPRFELADLAEAGAADPADWALIECVA